MDATSLFKTTGTDGDIRLLAAQNIIVGDIETLAGDVAITATAGNISDADALSGGLNDSDIDVKSSGLRLWAGLGVSDTVNHIETTVTTLSARATSGGIYILESTGLIVGDVSVSTNRVASDASLSTANSSDATQSDVRTTAGNGNIVLRATGDSIILDNGTTSADNTAISADGTGNILVQAIGFGKNITAYADIVSGSGNISIIAAQNVEFKATADIRTTSASSTTGTIDVFASNGSISMDAASLFKTAGADGDIRLKAGLDVIVGDIETAGDVSHYSNSNRR